MAEGDLTYVHSMVSDAETYRRYDEVRWKAQEMQEQTMLHNLEDEGFVAIGEVIETEILWFNLIHSEELDDEGLPEWTEVQRAEPEDAMYVRRNIEVKIRKR